MPRTAQNACCLLLMLGLGVASLTAQPTRQTASSDETQTASPTRTSLPTKAVRPASTVDGLAILTAALDSRHRIVTRHDCSHFVHDLYEQAGYSYEYASSDDLYVGVDEFRLVTRPQPGDLAVWHGHVGIVVNAAFLFQPPQHGPRSGFLRLGLLEAARPSAVLPLCEPGNSSALWPDPQCQLETRNWRRLSSDGRFDRHQPGREL